MKPELVNPYDKHVTQHLYRVSLTSAGISFLVHANHEDDTLDETMDYIVEKGYEGLYFTQENEEHDNPDYTTAGNFGYKFSTFNIFVERIKTK